MDSVSNITVIVLLLAVNGFYVAAKFSLVKLHGFRIVAPANQSSLAAKLTCRIQANLESYLAVCQLAITMTLLGLGWAGEPAVATIFEPLLTRLGLADSMIHTTAFIIGFLFLSALQIVIGEQVPTALAIRKAGPVSLWVAYPLHCSYLVTRPLIRVLNLVTHTILTFLKLAEASHAAVFSDEDTPGLVTTSKNHSDRHDPEVTSLHPLFASDQRHAGHIMIPVSSANVLDISQSAMKNIEVVRKTGHSRFPLVDSNNSNALIGMVFVKDIYRAKLEGELEPWSNLEQYKRDAMVVSGSQPIARVFDSMQIRRAHMVCVIDGYGGFIGIITLEDLLAEIGGVVEGETDDVNLNASVKYIDETHWEVDGLTSLSDLERSTGLVVRG